MTQIREARIRWTGDHYAHLIWVCERCSATGSGETEEGLKESITHRFQCPELHD